MLISVVFITNFFQSEYLSVVSYLSSMVNGGYQGNFKLVYFFLVVVVATRRFRANKTQTIKQKGSIFVRTKNI